MHKGPTDEDNAGWGGLNVGGGVGRVEESSGGEMGTAVIEQ